MNPSGAVDIERVRGGALAYKNLEEVLRQFNDTFSYVGYITFNEVGI